MVSDSGTSAADEREGTPPVRGAACPTCGRWTASHERSHRPFCSLGCRLIDLGVWLDEGYRIDGDGPESEDVP